jgi:hypothetical protein
MSALGDAVAQHWPSPLLSFCWPPETTVFAATGKSISFQQEPLTQTTARATESHTTSESASHMASQTTKWSQTVTG